jgi:hypothetical protein
MSWETRNGRGRYYTRSFRRDGRVIRQYVGSGPEAEREAEADRQKRLERETALAARRRKEAEAKALAKRVSELSGRIRLLAHATLVASGYRQHHGGEWRRRRCGQ